MNFSLRSSAGIYLIYIPNDSDFCYRCVAVIWCTFKPTDSLVTDHETDALIQSTLRHHLGKDVTVLIVAHRLHTVIDADKIVRKYLYSESCETDNLFSFSQMVLDEGHIVSISRQSFPDYKFLMRILCID